MAAVRVARANHPGGLVLGGGGGATAESYLLPVILGISIVSFLIWAAVLLAPTEDAMRYDEALIDHIRRRSAEPLGLRTATSRPAPVNGYSLGNGHAPGDRADQDQAADAPPSSPPG